MSVPTPPQSGNPLENLKKLPWAELETSTVTRIRILRAIIERMEPNPVNAQIAAQLVYPAVSLLIEFFNRVEIGHEEGESDHEQRH